MENRPLGSKDFDQLVDVRHLTHRGRTVAGRQPSHYLAAAPQFEDCRGREGRAALERSTETAMCYNFTTTLALGVAVAAVAAFGLSLSAHAAPSAGSASPAAPAPNPRPQALAIPPDVACNRARVAAHDAWAIVEADLQRQFDEAQAAIKATDPNHLPPAWMVPDGTVDRRIKALQDARTLGVRVAAVRQARASSILGAVLARDAARAVDSASTTDATTKASAAAWQACRDVAPATPAPCP